ncbi:hypothetical protein CPLU01_03167 [Colletotrichum plurivorum]|uniref:Uncharacterized protein n=1 Tax=Colletotrichum plurivorum TaxID=2175906 RepID=A0A8H6NLL1_9PEZI|nr:hypothetical protein CPLU01_03167 [Colletotrichum plurivorum]
MPKLAALLRHNATTPTQLASSVVHPRRLIPCREIRPRHVEDRHRESQFGESYDVTLGGHDSTPLDPHYLRYRRRHRIAFVYSLPERRRSRVSVALGPFAPDAPDAPMDVLASPEGTTSSKLWLCVDEILRRTVDGHHLTSLDPSLPRSPTPPAYRCTRIVNPLQAQNSIGLKPQKSIPDSHPHGSTAHDPRSKDGLYEQASTLIRGKSPNAK